MARRAAAVVVSLLVATACGAQVPSAEPSFRIDSFRRSFPGVEVNVDPDTRLPTQFRGLNSGVLQAPRSNPTDAALGVFDRLGAAAFPSMATKLRVRPLHVAKDPNFSGVTQVLVQQMFGGIEVYGATATVSVRENAPSTFVADSLSSGFKNVPFALSTSPEIQPGRARDVAQSDYARMTQRSPEVARSERILLGNSTSDAPPTLTIFVDESKENQSAKLAFRVNVGSFLYFIDAGSAEVIRRVRLVNRLVARETSDVMDGNASPGQPVLSDDNQLVSDVSSEARTSHEIVAKVLEYWTKHFARRSYDDNGATLFISARIGGWQNSAWFRKRAFFGTGYAFSPEIVAHELMHGLIEAMQRLNYHDEPGALNESISDFYGVALRADLTGRVDWRLGAEIPFYKMKGVALRDMKNPSQKMFDRKSKFVHGQNSGQPSHYSERVTVADPMCKDMDEYNDNGCVHINSGIFNKALQLLVDGGVHSSHTVSPIGIGKTERILFRALKTKYTQLTTLRQGAEGFVAACRELYGKMFTMVPPSECLNAEIAFRAVGLR